MLHALLPAQLDNDYRGHAIALWAFGLIAFITVGRSLVHILWPDGGAQSVATIPLDSFTAGGSATVISFFAQWGWSQLLMGGVYCVVLARYRTALPLMYAVLFLEYAGRVALAFWKPAVFDGLPPGGPFSFVMMAASLLGVRLSSPRSSARGG